MKSSQLFVLALVLLLSKAEKLDETDTIEVSPECAGLILVGGGVAGGAATVAMISWLPTLLCSGGLCSTSVTAGSWAAFWQSTMPLIASESIFAKLQSIAMSGLGSSISLTTFGAAFGASGGKTYLKQFCRTVDEVDPKSTAGKAVQKNLKSIQAAEPYKTKAMDIASEARTVAEPYATKAYEVAIEGLFYATTAAEPYVNKAKNYLASEAFTNDLSDAASAAEPYVTKPIEVVSEGLFYATNAAEPYLNKAKNYLASEAVTDGLSDAASDAEPYVTKAKDVASEALMGAWNWLSSSIEEVIHDANVVSEGGEL